MDDSKLLADYVEHSSETAFHTLVSRHLNLVYSAALRQVNDPGLADEVTQAVFLLLARKAATLKNAGMLSGWLFRTTRFVALRALRAEQRRQRREHEAFDMQQLNTPDDAWKRIAPVLDEGLERLSETDRNALLLRFFKGKSHSETATALGLSEEAAKKRVSRSLDKLRGFFATRGFTISTTLLATALTANAVNAAPAGMASAVATSTLARAALAGASLPVLVNETLKAWKWVKLKTAFGLAAGGAVAIFVAIQFAPPKKVTGAQDSKPIRAAINLPHAGTVVAASATPPSAAQAFPTAERAIYFHLAAAASAKPVPHARLAINIVVQGSWKQRYDLATDDMGSCRVTYPDDTLRLDIGALADGWEARFATWVTPRDGVPPAEYTMRLGAVTNVFTGFVRDEAGRPIVGAEIIASFGGTGDASNKETPRERFGFVADGIPVTKTDGFGKWSAAIMPNRNEGFDLKARHADFQTGNIVSYGSGAEMELERLTSGTLVTILHPGAGLRGRVLTESGDPIAGATIYEAIQQPVFRTDASGVFTVPKLEGHSWSFTIAAEGYAPERKHVSIEPGMETTEIRLKAGAILRLHLVDETGADVPDGTVGIEQWGDERQALDWKMRSGADGRIESTSAPAEIALEMYAAKDGFCYTRGIDLRADGVEHEIQMRHSLNVSGAVRDAVTGAPVTSFKVFPGYGESWERLDTRKSSDGTFNLTFSETQDPWRARVEAEGYETAISEPIPFDFKGALDFTLQKLDPATAIRGRVLYPDEQPASGVEVALITTENNVVLGKGHLAHPDASWTTKANVAGEFSFPTTPSAYGLVAVGERGYARVRAPNPREPLTLHLLPWGRIEGVVEKSARTAPIETVALSDLVAGRVSRSPVGLDFGMSNASLDENGNFTFGLIPPGEFFLDLNPGPGKPFHHRTVVKVTPGETTRVSVGSKGPIVKGRFRNLGVEEITDWSKQIVFAALNTDDPVLPSFGAGAGTQLRQLDYWESEHGRGLARISRSIRLNVNPDGAFVSEDEVPPGEYNLINGIGPRPRVKIPESNDSEPGVLDLGVIALGMPVQSVGQ